MKQIHDDIYHVGVNDRTKHRFEGLWYLPLGVSYNAYLVVDEQVALIDTVDAAVLPEFLDHIRAAIGDRPIDYLVINHMEPDHSGAIAMMRRYYPGLRLVGNKKTFEMVKGFYGLTTEGDVVVSDGDSLSLGRRTLTFHLAPMLHWPETMVTHIADEGILFSGDAFGCFGSLNGAVVDTEMDTTPYWPEMERYFAAILGKFCPPVRTALKKLGALDIRMICSTHGPVWTTEAPRAIDTYRRLSYGETTPGLVVCYGSMYGHTQRMAEAVAEGAAAAGLHKIIVHNLSVSQPSFVLADIFRYRGVAIGGPTYNGGLYPVVEDLLKRLAGREVSHHLLGYFGGFTWSGQAVKTIAAYNAQMKMTEVTPPVEWKQAPGADALESGRALGRALAEGILAEEA
jgi:flavorubredoxin